MDSNNALLPPLDMEDFKTTATYHLLEVHPVDCALLCGLFSVSGLSELEFTANPRRQFHTMYDYDDFAEILSFLRYNGKPVKLPSTMSRDVRRSFSVVDTSVGDLRYAVQIQGKSKVY